MKRSSTASLLLFALAFVNTVFAQETKPKKFDTRVNVMFGLNQPLLAKGFNIEGNLFVKRFVFDYSHGTSLDFSGNTVSGALKEQKLAVHMPYTTGFGIGYRLTQAFNVRMEPKWHRFQIYYDGEEQSEKNKIADYTTFSLGVGAYLNWLPFKNKPNALRGVMVAPSLRYWPRLNSSLNNDAFSYMNKRTNRMETHEAMQAGISNSPFIFNVSVGYSVKLNGKRNAN